MLAHLFLIESLSKLLVTRTGIKARLSSILGWIRPFILELLNQDRHKSSDEFDFGPLVSMAHLYVFEMRFDLGTLDSGERSLPFGLLVVQNYITPLWGRHQFSHRKQIIVTAIFLVSKFLDFYSNPGICFPRAVQGRNWHCSWGFTCYRELLLFTNTRWKWLGLSLLRYNLPSIWATSRENLYAGVCDQGRLKPDWSVTETS